MDLLDIRLDVFSFTCNGKKYISSNNETFVSHIVGKNIVTKKIFSVPEIKNEDLAQLISEFCDSLKTVIDEGKIIILNTSCVNSFIDKNNEMFYMKNNEQFKKRNSFILNSYNVVKTKLPHAVFIESPNFLYCDAREHKPFSFYHSKSYYAYVGSMIDGIILNDDNKIEEARKHLLNYQEAVKGLTPKNLEFKPTTLLNFKGKYEDYFGNVVISKNPIDRVYIGGKNNTIDLSHSRNLKKVSFSLNGDGNYFCTEDGGSIETSSINFLGNNSLIFLNSNKESHKVNVQIYNESTVYLGKDCGMNGPFLMICGEGKNIFVGDKVLISSNCSARTSDAHALYDATTLKRINIGKSVYIGDGVWIGNNVTMLKGCEVYSGSLIGSCACATGKKYYSGSCYGGNPAKEIRKNILIDRKGTHFLTPSDAKANVISSDKASELLYIFDDKVFLPFEEIENHLSKFSSSREKLRFLKENILNGPHNRFSFTVDKETTH